eukprot:COSAG01_NODE_2904_length_6887_cov_2.857543_8_plen_107_part_00
MPVARVLAAAPARLEVPARSASCVHIYASHSDTRIYSTHVAVRKAPPRWSDDPLSAINLGGRADLLEAVQNGDITTSRQATEAKEATAAAAAAATAAAIAAKVLLT